MKIAKLTQTAILEVSGADALIFLQGQLSQDIASIEIKQAALASLSNHKGRLLAVMHVYKIATDQYYLCLPITVIDDVQQHLQKYVFRSKVSSSKLDDLLLYGIWDLSENNFTQSFSLAKHCDLKIVISETALEQNNLVDEQLWNQQKILQAIPDVFAQTSEKFVAQMLNLDLLNGVSFNKGCYTGQEIIARSQHLGRIKRRMLLLETEQLLEIGASVSLDERNIGKIVNSCVHEERKLALAVMQLDYLPDDSTQADFSCLPMPYSVKE